MNPASGAPRVAPVSTPNITPADPDTLCQHVVQCRLVLVETSHPGNIGSVVRVPKTMGFGKPGSFAFVHPREADTQSYTDAVVMVSGADDVLTGTRVVDDIGEVLAGASLTITLTARPCEFGPRRIGLRDAAGEVATLLAAPSTTVAFILGNGRFGLPDEMMECYHAVTHILVNPAYASLNLPQTVQLIAYEVCMALLAGAGTDDTRMDGIGFVSEPAIAERIDGIFEHLEQDLVEIGFLNPAQPKKLMPRLRRLSTRTQLEAGEVSILRGIIKHILGHRVEAAVPPTGAADDCRRSS